MKRGEGVRLVSVLKTLALIVVLAGVAMMGLSEWGEVVVVRPLGIESASETRVWVVDLPEGAYVRGSRGKAWTESAVAAGQVAVRRDGRWLEYRVVDAPGRPVRERVNAAMRAKYGLSDQIIGWVREFDEVRPLRLEPL